MKRSQCEAKFLDYLEGLLSERERQSLEAALAADEELRLSFERYKKLAVLEKAVARELPPPRPAVIARILEQVESADVGFFERLLRMMLYKKLVYSGAAAMATAVVLAGLWHAARNDVHLPQVTIEKVSVNQKDGRSISEGAVIGAAADAAAVPLSSAPTAAVSAAPDAAPPEGLKGERSYAEAGERNFHFKTAPPLQGHLMGMRGKARSKKDDGDAIPHQGFVGRFPDHVPANSAGGSPASKGSGYHYVSSDERDEQPLLQDHPGMTESWAKEVEKLGMKGPLAKKMIALMQTEPGVRVGDIAAEQIGMGRVSPVYQADQMIRYNLPGSEFARQADLASYHDCMAKQQAQLGWLNAAYLCNEVYAGYDENRLIQTADEALSTFSIDVDTGSYTNARRFLAAGNLPPPDSVRIEEFINYFPYDYPIQRDKAFAVSYEAAPSPLQGGRYLLKLGVKARDPGEAVKLWNLVFLVDVSGSMDSENKLPLLRRALALLASKMRANDRMSLVTYDSSARVVLDGVSAAGKDLIVNTISQLAPSGSTNGESGLRLAYTTAKKNMIPGGINRVILATDGDFNTGVYDQAELERMISAERSSGVALTALGVGEGNYKEPRLERLADLGNGNYFYLDSFSEARRVFEEQLVGVMEVVAKDVKLQVEFNPKHVAEYRLVGYDNRMLEKRDFNDDGVDAGEIGAGHTVTALYELVLTGSPGDEGRSEYRYQKQVQQQRQPAAGFQNELAFVKVRYKQPDAEASNLLTFPIERTQLKSSAASASDDFRFAAAVSAFAAGLRHSRFDGGTSIDTLIRLAEGAQGQDASGQRREFIGLMKNAKARLN